MAANLSTVTRSMPRQSRRRYTAGATLQQIRPHANSLQDENQAE